MKLAIMAWSVLPREVGAIEGVSGTDIWRHAESFMVWEILDHEEQ